MNAPIFVINVQLRGGSTSLANHYEQLIKAGTCEDANLSVVLRDLDDLTCRDFFIGASALKSLYPRPTG
jgi:hypothetical protein